MNLNISKQVRSCQIMLYTDQIGYRKEEIEIEEQKKILKDWLDSIKLDGVLFYGIVHDSDLTTLLDDDGYSDKDEKPHIHLVFYSNKVFRPITIFKKLGIEIIKDDETLYTHGGFSYLNNKNHDTCKAIMYLVHQTDAAVLENKFPYNITDIVSNDTGDWFLTYKEEYLTYSKGLFVNKKGKVRELDEENMLFDILDEVFKLGYNLGDFDSYLESLPRRYKYKYEKKIEEYYYKGVHRRYEDKASLDVHRVSIFIYGPAGCGKTYGSVHTLIDMNRKVYQVGQSSGTGGEDNIKPNDCLIYDDRIPKNALDKADTNICELYRRNSGNGVFGGDFFIINHNRDFDDAFKNYYKDKDDVSTGLSEEARALKTRFYILEVNSCGMVTVKSRCSRGLDSDRKLKDDKFEEFLKRFSNYVYDLYIKSGSPF